MKLHKKMGKWLFILLLFINIFSIKIFSNSCHISKKIFDHSDNQCKEFDSTLKEAINQLTVNLRNAFENPDDDCIPEKLRGELLTGNLFPLIPARP